MIHAKRLLGTLEDLATFAPRLVLPLGLVLGAVSLSQAQPGDDVRPSQSQARHQQADIPGPRVETTTRDEAPVQRRAAIRRLLQSPPDFD